ncbi:MAG: amidohydrolase family protein [Sphingomonadaceae bacterium]
MTVRIDSHHHVWQRARGDYGWLTPESGPLWNDFAFADLAPALDAGAIGRTVLVQAAPTLAETCFLLETAAASPRVAGVVGWADLAAPDAFSVIAALATRPRLVGLRPMLQDLADDGWILRREVQPALAAMAGGGLTFDALVRPRHLPILAELRQQHPALAIVIDHGAKPDIAGGDLRAWKRDLAAVASDGMTCCKLSGLVTEAGPGWTIETLRPAVEAILELFGPERVMWGSDWPVLLLAGSYAGWLAAAEALIEPLPAADRALVMGGTAARFYGLEV